MVQTSDQVQFQDKATFIWQVADDILFGPFMHNEFRDVVLPFVVLRRGINVRRDKEILGAMH